MPAGADRNKARVDAVALAELAVALDFADIAYESGEQVTATTGLHEVHQTARQDGPQGLCRLARHSSVWMCLGAAHAMSGVPSPDSCVASQRP